CVSVYAAEGACAGSVSVTRGTRVLVLYLVFVVPWALPRVLVLCAQGYFRLDGESRASLDTFHADSAGYGRKSEGDIFVPGRVRRGVGRRGLREDFLKTVLR
ncbi:unnamed protein product, partial [Hapterophycus canaliculatus]